MPGPLFNAPLIEVYDYHAKLWEKRRAECQKLLDDHKPDRNVLPDPARIVELKAVVQLATNQRDGWRRRV